PKRSPATGRRARCAIITAQRTPSATEANVVRSPSPSHFTSRPPWLAKASRSSWRCACRMRCPPSAPTRWSRAVESTRSVNSSVTGAAVIGCGHTISGGRPESVVSCLGYPADSAGCGRRAAAPPPRPSRPPRRLAPARAEHRAAGAGGRSRCRSACIAVGGFLGSRLACELLYSDRETVTGKSESPGSGQLVEQRLRLDEIARVEALGEPGVDGRQQGTGLGGLALTLPEPREARRGAQLQGFRLLCPRDVERAAEERVGLRAARGSGGEE